MNAAATLGRLVIPNQAQEGGGPRPRTPLKSPGTVGLPSSPPAPGLLSTGALPPKPWFRQLFPSKSRSRSRSRGRQLSSSPTSPPGSFSLLDVYRHPGTRRWLIVVLSLSVVVYTLFIKKSDNLNSIQTKTGSRAKVPFLRSGQVEVSEDDGIEDDLDDSTPTVDRTALDKLRLLEIHWIKQDESNSGIIFPDPDLEDDDAGSNHGLPAAASASAGADEPPLVAVIPEAARRRPNLPERIIRLLAAELDREVCPDQPAGCAFLLPSYIGDQLHLAQEHLHQLGLLAIALNRTLILPATSKSRMGSCQTFGFGMYWNKQSFDDVLGVPTITQAAFLDWAERREEIATGQLVSMLGGTEAYPFGAVEIASSSEPLSVPGRGPRNTCLRSDRARLNFEPSSPLAIYPPPNTYQKSLEFGESVIETLLSEELGRKSSRASTRSQWRRPNVLAINYEVRWPIFTPELVVGFAPWLERMPSAFERPFESAEMWTKLGQQILAERAPMAAISWRIEQVEGENVAPCVDSMVEQLRQTYIRHPSLRAVYISTDFPVDEGDAVSPQVLKSITPEHTAAFARLEQLVRERLPQLEVLTFERLETSFPEETYPGYLAGAIKRAGNKLHKDGRDKPKGVKFGLADLDIALVGLVEKVIMQQAEVILMPGPTVDEEGDLVNTCGTGMIGTEGVVESRREEWASQVDEEEFMQEQYKDDVPGLVWEVVKTWP